MIFVIYSSIFNIIDIVYSHQLHILYVPSDSFTCYLAEHWIIESIVIII